MLKSEGVEVKALLRSKILIGNSTLFQLQQQLPLVVLIFVKQFLNRIKVYLTLYYSLKFY